MNNAGVPAARSTLIRRADIAMIASRWLGIVTLLVSGCAAAQVQDVPTCFPGGWPGVRSLLPDNRAHILELEAAEERFGTDSVEMLPAMSDLIQWYTETEQCAFARPYYRHMISIMEKSYGKNDLRLVQPLTGLATTYVSERNFRPEGRQALERIVRLYDTGNPQDESAQADALIAVGDWQLLSGDPDDALDTYSQAWRVLAEAAPPLLALARTKLGSPRTLPSIRNDPLAPEAIPALGGYYIKVEFDATLDGTPKDIRIVESNADAMEQREFRRIVSQGYYRPALEDGEPVETHVEMRYVWQ